MSPTMQDSKFEVIMSSESDLEEGEILEFDFSTSKPQVEDGEVADDYYTSKSSERLRSKFKMKHEKEYLGNDYIRQEKLPDGNRKLRDYKRSYKLTKSSSDGEISDADRKDSKKLSLTIRTNSIDRKSKQKHGLKGSYGTVEDIMTQIDATLCRKSLCNFKRRKSREIHYSLERTRRTRSSSKEEKPKSRHRSKKSSSSESDSDSVLSRNKKSSRNIIPVCKRKREKEKIKEVVYVCSDDSSDDDSAPRKKGSAVKKKRDFDEYRKQLLEKLSKEKVDTKSNCENIPLPAEEELTNSSDIQEIEMTDDTNAFVDDKVDDVIKPPEVTNKSFMDSFYVTRNVPVVSEPQESEGEDDDTELIKLRLLALTSNRKKKEAVSDDASSHSLDLEQSSNVDVKSEGNLSDKEEQDSDLDRNEFLLRAEALKTALLKKHKLKKAKESVVENSKLTEVSEEKLKNNEEINIQVKLEVRNSVNVPEIPTQPKENIQNDNSSPGEVINPLEIARRKLLKVRNVLMMSDASNNSDIREDSLQARLLALANETSLPKPIQNNSNETPAFMPKLKKVENNSKPGISRKRRKRLRWKMRRRNKNRNKLNLDALKENAVDSVKPEDDDEKLRVQLLNDLSTKKLSKGNKDNLQMVENKASEIVENKPLIDKQIINVKNNKNSNKVAPLGIVPKAEIQRIIVHLGSDSSDDEDLEPEVKPPDLKVPSEEKVAEEVPSSTAGNVNPLLADYERSVELLLQKAREEVERKEKNQKNVTATPEAVYKHLPPSQRLEYIRLKQKIAEKENLKKKTTAAVESNPSQTKSDPIKDPLNGIKRIVASSVHPVIKENQLPAKPSSRVTSSSNNLQSSSITVSIEKKNHSPIKCDKINSDSSKPLKSITVNKPTTGNVLRSPVKTITASKMGSPFAPLKKILNSTINGKKPVVSPEQRKIIVQNQANISRLKLLLKKIKIEKTVEERYEKEIQKLKNQLNLLELKRKQQRVKIENLAKESKIIYASFQSNRTDIKKLNDAGKVVENEKTEEKKESQPKDNVKEERMEVQASNVETKEISQNCENKPDNQSKVESESEIKAEIKFEPKNKGHVENQVESSLPSVSSSNAFDLKEYNSPLQAFTTRTEDQDGKRINPNAIMCQYDLLGKCNDKECTFQHYRTS